MSHLRASTADPQLVSSVIHMGNCEMPLLENPSTPVEPVIISRTRHGYHVIGSCNGLLCLYDIRQSNFTLWNPSIKFKSKTSPIIGSSAFTRMRLYGFGYDHINDKYKVLLDVRKMTVGETVTRIYTFGEKSWRTVPSLPGKSRFGVRVGKFVSGTLNWIVHNSNQWVILSFDLRRRYLEKCCFLNTMVTGITSCMFPVTTFVFVLITPKKIIGMKIIGGVWMMKQYGVAESWTKVMIIPRKKFNYPYGNPLIISENVVLMKIMCSKLVCYNNLNNGGIDYPRILGELGHEMHIYHESLVSPHW